MLDLSHDGTRMLMYRYTRFRDFISVLDRATGKRIHEWRIKTSPGYGWFNPLNHGIVLFKLANAGEGSESHIGNVGEPETSKICPEAPFLNTADIRPISSSLAIGTIAPPESDGGGR
jgi:hypothetical protein